MDSGIKAIVAGGALLILLTFAIMFWPLTSVKAGHSGVVTLFGNVQGTVLEPGLHVVNPMAHVIEVDTRQMTYTADGEVGTKDLQSVHGAVVVNYHVVPSAAAKLYQSVGKDFDAILIGPAVQDRLKAITPHFNAEELVTKRSVVTGQVRDSVREAILARSSGMLVVDDVVVTNFDFAQSFKLAIEAKQVADQKALTAENDLRRIKVEAEQQIATARASAESFRMQSQQITPQMLQMEAIKKWNGTLPTFLSPGAALPFIGSNFSKGAGQ
jgi:regulator of protease activity HflC (stomatin/prohibitin superfamily)